MMLIDIPEDDKIRVGYFIDIERKHKNKKDKAFIIENYIKDICSRQTYNKIVKGMPLKESEVYDQLLEKLGYQYNYDDSHTKNISNNTKIMNKALNEKNLTIFYRVLFQCIEELKAFNTKPIEVTTYTCYQIIQKTETQTKLSKTDFNYLIDHFAVVRNDEKEIIAYFIFSYLYHQDISDKNLKYTIQRVDFFNVKEPYNKVYVLDLLVRLQQYYDASVYCDKLLTELKSTGNMEAYMECLLTRIMLVSEIQPGSFEKYKQKFFEIQNEDKKGIHLCEFYHIAGLHYYRNKKMEQAYECFLKAVQNKKFLFPEIIFINHIATLLHYEIPMELKIEQNVERYDEVWQYMYKFYCMKHRNESLEILEEYLWKNGRRIVKVTYPAWMMKNIIVAELTEIANCTGNRKRLYQFNNIKV